MTRDDHYGRPPPRISGRVRRPRDVSGVAATLVRVVVLVPERVPVPKRVVRARSRRLRRRGFSGRSTSRGASRGRGSGSRARRSAARLFAATAGAHLASPASLGLLHRARRFRGEVDERAEAREAGVQHANVSVYATHVVARARGLRGAEPEGIVATVVVPVSAPRTRTGGVRGPRTPSGRARAAAAPASSVAAPAQTRERLARATEPLGGVRRGRGVRTRVPIGVPSQRSLAICSLHLRVRRPGGPPGRGADPSGVVREPQSRDFGGVTSTAERTRIVQPHDVRPTGLSTDWKNATVDAQPDLGGEFVFGLRTRRDAPNDPHG